MTALLPACAVAGGRAADLSGGPRLDVFPGDSTDALRLKAARPDDVREVFLAVEFASDLPRAAHRNYAKLLRDTHVTRNACALERERRSTPAVAGTGL
jgi:hypothetical protein